MLSNYIPDNTRMAVPPPYFLQRLYDFDNMLVLMPSRRVPFAYVIARRRQRTAGLSTKALMDSIDQPDTKMCLKHGCVPVSLMYRTGSTWDIDSVIRTLAARDMWALGGADKVADMLEAQESRAEAANKAAIRDDLWNRSGDGWRTYQHRTGQSTIRSKDFHPPKGQRTSNSPSSGSTAAGLVLTD